MRVFLFGMPLVGCGASERGAPTVFREREAPAGAPEGEGSAGGPEHSVDPATAPSEADGVAAAQAAGAADAAAPGEPLPAYGTLAGLLGGEAQAAEPGSLGFCGEGRANGGDAELVASVFPEGDPSVPACMSGQAGRWVESVLRFPPA